MCECASERATVFASVSQIGTHPDRHTDEPPLAMCARTQTRRHGEKRAHIKHCGVHVSVRACACVCVCVSLNASIYKSRRGENYLFHSDGCAAAARIVEPLNTNAHAHIRTPIEWVASFDIGLVVAVEQFMPRLLVCDREVPRAKR